MNIAYEEQQRKILNELTIRQVFEKYISAEFNRQGFCRCPFHAERTASFKLFENNDSFYCFGCGAGGNLINLCAKANNIGYLEAMKKLDEEFGVGAFRREIKTDIQRSREAAAKARKRLESDRLREMRKEKYYKLIDYFKWVKKQPESAAKSHDIEYIERLLDKWLAFDREPFDRVPDDFDADALISALKNKFREEGENGGN